MPKVSSKLPLTKTDLAQLRASGLTDSTIRANGLRSECDSANLAAILNRSQGEQCCLGGLVFPYRDMNGEVNCFARVRPHMPRTRDGKPIKYEQPKGSPLRAYFPAASLDKLRDGTAQVFITEGEKKALALAQLGLAAVGIGGVDCWGKGGVLLPDLAALDWCGRDVGIVFDYDEKGETRRQVESAKRRLATALKAAGAREVYSVDLPPGPDGAKQGVDDYLVTHDSEALKALIEQAQPVLHEGGNTVTKIIPVATPELGDAAYHGLVGEFLRAVAPYTEATDAGVLAHLLPAVGMLVGPGPRVWAGNNQFARINAVVVGRTNAGRKGTSFAPVDLLMEKVASAFWSRQRIGGLSSGEGLISYVADREEKNEDGETVVVPVEKRLFVVEEEFSRVLANMRRDGNILSHIIRSAFDNGNLATLTVSPRHASGAHVSIVGHITPEELSARLEGVEMANGFGNRFLWFAVESSKVMSRTTPIPDSVFEPFVERLSKLRLRYVTVDPRHISLAQEAQDRWDEIYPQLREDRPGIAGQMVARGSSMVLRLALIYALLDDRQKPSVIRVAHLEAASAVWAYCEASAQLLFESTTGDKFCDKLLKLLAGGPMTKDDFNKHLSAKQKADVGKALEKLEAWKVVRRSAVKHEGAGRPATRWEIVEG